MGQKDEVIPEGGAAEVRGWNKLGREVARSGEEGRAPRETDSPPTEVLSVEYWRAETG